MPGKIYINSDRYIILFAHEFGLYFVTNQKHKQDILTQLSLAWFNLMI
jgi:hypothetical protein